MLGLGTLNGIFELSRVATQNAKVNECPTQPMALSLYSSLSIVLASLEVKMMPII